jgi:hypothetical protein
MKIISISFICLFYMLNSSAAIDDGRKWEVKFASMNVIENENSNFSSTTMTKKNIQKNTLLKIPPYFQNHLFSNQKANSNNFNELFNLAGSSKKTINEKYSFTKKQTTLKKNRTVVLFAEEILTNATATYTYQEANLKLKSSSNRYFTIGLLVGKKTSTAFVSNVIHTQSEKIGHMKFKAKINSVSLTVFF